jgi:SAM-dependent methyltransferase
MDPEMYQSSIALPFPAGSADGGAPDPGPGRAGSTSPGSCFVDMAAAYDHYFSSGLYARRYPKPNRNMLALVRSHLRPDARVLDFGCGTGRYVGPLLNAGARVIGYDISSVALRTLAARYRQAVAAGRLLPVGGTLEALAAAVEPGSVDLALLMFGVLGHVRGTATRLNTLKTVARLLGPAGKLIVTVPNAALRFRAEQAACAPLVARGELEPGDIVYRRQAADGPVDLYYHLFEERELCRLLHDAGLAVHRLGAESVLAERTVLTLPAGHLLDRALMALVPRRLAQGFAAVATPQPVA